MFFLKNFIAISMLSILLISECIFIIANSDAS